MHKIICIFVVFQSLFALCSSSLQTVNTAVTANINNVSLIKAFFFFLSLNLTKELKKASKHVVAGFF